MNILSPLKSAEEIEQLIAHGATEFYCGYVPASWIRAYRDPADVTDMYLPINKREGFADNLLDIAAIRHCVRVALKWDVPLFVTLNRLNYPQGCYDVLRECIEELVQAGVQHFIVTDIGLVHWFHHHYSQVHVVLSTCAMSLNSWSSRLYADLGVQRITLPRHMSITEIERVCAAMPSMEFECFILDQGCQYDDGNCKILHSCSAICREQWSYEYFRVDHGAFTSDEIEELYRNERYYTHYLRPYPSKDYMVNNWGTIFCAACHLPRLVQIPNLTSLKITGRAKALAEKEQLVHFAKVIMDMALDGASHESVCQHVQQEMGAMLCETRQRCYMNSL